MDSMAKYIVTSEAKAFCRLSSLWTEKRDRNTGILNSACAFLLPDKRGVWGLPLWAGSGVGWASLLIRHEDCDRQKHLCCLDLCGYPYPSSTRDLYLWVGSFCGKDPTEMIPDPEPVPAGSSLQLQVLRQVTQGGIWWNAVKWQDSHSQPHLTVKDSMREST